MNYGTDRDWMDTRGSWSWDTGSRVHGIEVFLSIYRPGDDGNGMHLCYDFSDLTEWFRVWHTLWSYALVAVCYSSIDWNAIFQVV